MQQDMVTRGLGSHTQHDYVRHVRGFAAFLGRPHRAARPSDGADGGQDAARLNPARLNRGRRYFPCCRACLPDRPCRAPEPRSAQGQRSRTAAPPSAATSRPARTAASGASPTKEQRAGPERGGPCGRGGRRRIRVAVRDLPKPLRIDAENCRGSIRHQARMGGLRVHRGILDRYHRRSRRRRADLDRPIPENRWDTADATARDKARRTF